MTRWCLLFLLHYTPQDFDIGNYSSVYCLVSFLPATVMLLFYFLILIMLDSNVSASVVKVSSFSNFYVWSRSVDIVVEVFKKSFNI